MHAMKLLAETAKTVTISRADLEAPIQAAEDAQELASVQQRRRDEERACGYGAAKANYFTADEAKRLLAGESPVRIWREKRDLSQRALAETANVQPGYLSEIETGKKPGGPAAYIALSTALNIRIGGLT